MRRNSTTRVLVVEDVELEAKLVMRSLADAGYSNIAHAKDVDGALAVVESTDIRMVVTDLALEGSSGIELTRRLRAREHGDYVYVMALTSHRGEEDMSACFEAGVDDFMGKPFDRLELVARLRAGERIVDLERRLSRKSHELETALRRIDVTAAQRALARAEQPLEDAMVAGATPLQALAGTTTWRDVESLLAKVTGEFFQLRFDSAPIQNDVASPFIAEISLSEPAKQLAIAVAVVVDAGTMSHLSRHLLGEDDLESSRALILELANILMGALKPAFGAHGFAFTGGLPCASSLAESKAAFEASSMRSRLAIGTADAHVELWLRVVEKRNTLLRGRQLEEGLVICRDVHDPCGMLLVRGGSRLTHTAAERLVAAIPDVEVEVSTPSV